MPVLPGAAPFHLSGGSDGVLLCHGFTSTPQSMRPWAEYLAEHGFTVDVPRLPGHGTRWQDMRVVTWADWYDTVERGLDALADRCERVSVGGMSMGAALALRLALRRPDDVTSLVLVNPAIASRRFDLKLVPVLHRLIDSRPGIKGDIQRTGATEIGYERMSVRGVYEMTKLWKAVRGDLAALSVPTLVYRSRVDHVVDSSSIELIMESVRHTVVRERILERGFHVATLDHDADTLFAGSAEWFAENRSPAGRSNPPADTAPDGAAQPER